MDKTSLQKTDLARKGITRTELGLLVFITIALVLKFYLIFLLKIGWDEFFYLSKVYTYIRGTLTGQFQTFYVHFFTWLSYISDNEVTQVIAARLVLYSLFLGACIYTYLIGRQFLNRSGALFGVFCYVSLSNIVVHGTSFRADSICSFLFLLSVYHILTSPRSKVLISFAGFAMALSLMVSIKVAFHLLTIGVIFLCLFVLAENKRDVIKQMLFFALAFLGGFFLLYSFHSSTLLIPQVTGAKQFVSRAGSKVIILNDLFPQLPYLALSLKKNIFIWSFLILGIIIVTSDLIRSKGKRINRNLILYTFLIPLITLIFYRNAFPYFYVFIIAPAIIFCGVIVHKMTEDYRRTGSAFLIVLVAIYSFSVCINFLFHYLNNSSDRTIAQRELLQVVHKIFPEPVPYIDGCSAISSFPKVGLFMSTWGMEGYLQANRPIMHKILTQRQPVFLFANIPSLDPLLPRENAFTAINYALLEKDWKVLNSNFIHHWGILYVAGKQFKFDSDAGSQNFEILIPGTYTLEGEEAVFINGVVYEPGSTVNLKKGSHTITVQCTPTRAKLRWGEHLYRPSKEPCAIPIFYGF